MYKNVNIYECLCAYVVLFLIFISKYEYIKIKNMVIVAGYGHGDMSSNPGPD